MFARRSDRSGEHVLRIRTADLQQIGWLDLPSYFEGAGSDSHFAFLRPREGPPLPEPMEVFIRSISIQDSNSAALKRVFTTPCQGITFLDEETLGLSGGLCHDVTILRTSGQIEYQRQFDRALASGVVRRRDCDLIVFSTYLWRQENETLHIPAKTNVRSLVFFDRKTQNLVEVPRKVSVKHPGSLQLSPNGCSLAIRDDSRLEVYDMCNSPIAAKLRSPGP